MSERDEIVPGKLVRLLSGGPVMVVAEVDRRDWQVRVYWFAGLKLRQGVLPSDVLQLAGEEEMGTRGCFNCDNYDGCHPQGAPVYAGTSCGSWLEVKAAPREKRKVSCLDCDKYAGCHSPGAPVPVGGCGSWVRMRISVG